MEYRPYYISREWGAQGHEVRIAAASFSHVRSHQPDLLALRQAGASKFGHSIVERIGDVFFHWYSTPSYSGNKVGRLNNIRLFLQQVYFDARLYASEFVPDVVIASSTYPMDIWVAERIVKHTRNSGKPCKLVFEVHDLWPLSPIELGGMSPRHPFIMLCQAAEDYAYKHADLVISMLPKVSGHMQSHGLDLRKLLIVPNGITLDEWEGNAPPLRKDIETHILAEKNAGRTVVGYAGSHGTPNALNVLLESAASLRGENFSFVLIGDGHEKPALQQQARSLGLDNVAFFAPIPKAQIPSFLVELDVAYIGWQRVPIYRFGIAPNKLMDYMMAGCVVLHSVEAGNDPVAEAGCGLTVPPADPSAIAEGLRQLSKLDAMTRMRMGESGRQFVLAQHTYPVLARRFLEGCFTGA